MALRRLFTNIAGHVGKMERVRLAFMLCLIGWSNQASRDVNERFIYFMAAIVFVVCVYVFVISGLPVPQQAESLFANLLN